MLVPLANVRTDLGFGELAHLLAKLNLLGGKLEVH